MDKIKFKECIVFSLIMCLLFGGSISGFLGLAILVWLFAKFIEGSLMLIEIAVKKPKNNLAVPTLKGKEISAKL